MTVDMADHNPLAAAAAQDEEMTKILQATQTCTGAVEARLGLQGHVAMPSCIRIA